MSIVKSLRGQLSRRSIPKAICSFSALRSRRFHPVVDMGAARMARPHRHFVVRVFFRDPARVTPVRGDLVIAPADGVVSFAGFSAPPPELGLGMAPMLRVSIFMSIFDCHVNRAPVRAASRKSSIIRACF